MKITVAIPSRGRPAGLLAVLTALNALATGNHEITYAVIVDDDDYVTLEQLLHWEKSGMLPPGVQQITGARHLTVNARFNDACARCPADWYLQSCDDIYPLTQHWDALMYGARTLPAYCWQEANDPGNATILAISEKWRSTVGRFYPEYFPFWFADTWLAEVFNLAFAKPIPLINQLQMGGKRGQTQGMRDLEFWFRFFAVTRIERMKEAEAIAKAWGFTIDCRRDRQAQIVDMEASDHYQLGRVELYEKAFNANFGAETEVYRIAEARAKQWIQDHTHLLEEATA